MNNPKGIRYIKKIHKSMLTIIGIMFILLACCYAYLYINDLENSIQKQLKSFDNNMREKILKAKESLLMLDYVYSDKNFEKFKKHVDKQLKDTKGDLIFILSPHDDIIYASTSKQKSEEEDLTQRDYIKKLRTDKEEILVLGQPVCGIFSRKWAQPVGLKSSKFPGEILVYSFAIDGLQGEKCSGQGKGIDSFIKGWHLEKAKGQTLETSILNSLWPAFEVLKNYDIASYIDSLDSYLVIELDYKDIGKNFVVRCLLIAICLLGVFIALYYMYAYLNTLYLIPLEAISKRIGHINKLLLHIKQDQNSYLLLDDSDSEVHTIEKFVSINELLVKELQDTIQTKQAKETEANQLANIFKQSQSLHHNKFEMLLEEIEDCLADCGDNIKRATKLSELEAIVRSNKEYSSEYKKVISELLCFREQIPSLIDVTLLAKWIGKTDRELEIEGLKIKGHEVLLEKCLNHINRFLLAYGSHLVRVVYEDGKMNIIFTTLNDNGFTEVVDDLLFARIYAIASNASLRYEILPHTRSLTLTILCSKPNSKFI